MCTATFRIVALVERGRQGQQVKPVHIKYMYLKYAEPRKKHLPHYSWLVEGITPLPLRFFMTMDTFGNLKETMYQSVEKLSGSCAEGPGSRCPFASVKVETKWLIIGA